MNLGLRQTFARCMVYASVACVVGGGIGVGGNIPGNADALERQKQGVRLNAAEGKAAERQQRAVNYAAVLMFGLVGVNFSLRSLKRIKVRIKVEELVEARAALQAAEDVKNAPPSPPPDLAALVDAQLALKEDIVPQAVRPKTCRAPKPAQG